MAKRRLKSRRNLHAILQTAFTPGAPLTYFNDGGGGGGPKDFSGSGILAKRDFFGSMKDAGIFFGSRKQHRGFLEYCNFHQLKSTTT